MTDKNEESTVASKISDLRNLSKNASSAEVRPSDDVEAKQRQKIAVSSMRMQKNASGAGGFGGGAGMGLSGGGGAGANVSHGEGTNIYSPHLSTDFLELPQNLTEQRSYYRHFYNNDPYVGQAIDLHTELPLSKIRLDMPRGSDPERNREIKEFYEEMIERIGLLDILKDATREYYVIGEAFIFAEESEVEVPDEIRYKTEHYLDPETGECMTRKVERENADELVEKYKKEHYEGWKNLVILPPDQVNIESISFSDEDDISLVPDADTKQIINRAMQGDEKASEMVMKIPKEVREYVQEGRDIPLGTDPDKGSFVYHLARKKASYETHGTSLLQRCLLPGTSVAVKRDGIVKMEDVEEVDPDKDEILSHEGDFQSFEKGSRPVSEDIVSLEVEGQPEPLELTKDHEVFRVRNGQEELVEAGDLRKGDVLREVYPRSGDPEKTEKINLESWWKDIGSVDTDRRRHDDNRTLSVEKCTSNSNGLSICFRWEQDNHNRVESIKKRTKLVDWMKSLDRPAIKSYSEVSCELGLTKGKLSHYVKILRGEGVNIECDQDEQKTMWPPLGPDFEVPGQYSRKTVKSPISEIPLTDDFMYLMGTWLGDGSIWGSDSLLLNHDRLTWTFGNNEEGRSLRNHVKSILRDTFPDSEIEEAPLFDGNPNLALHVKDPLLTHFISEEFGEGCENNHLPEWVFDLEDSKVHSLIGGLIDTDGYVGKNNGSPRVELQMKNKTLIDQIHLICNRLGITTSVRKSNRQPQTITSTETEDGTVEKSYDRPERVYWRLSSTRTRDVYKCLEKSFLKRKRVSDHEAGSQCFDLKEMPLRRVVSVDERAYSGPVYSFSVEEDESHSAGFLAVHNCMRTLVYRDKLRQAQTSIASRAMTPKRMVWAEDLSEPQVEELRDQVDQALLDPDFSVITNYQVNWEEIGANDRLLNLSSEYDMVQDRLFAGLGVTRSMLTGDSSYSGERINLEVINTRYLLYREGIQNYVEENLFKPVARKKGFVEYDEFGNKKLLYPRLTFTRLAVRDNRDTFDNLFNLYQKGSLSVNYILELFNLDPDIVRDRLEQDIFTVSDATFNEAVRSILSEAGRNVVENSNFVEVFVEYLAKSTQFDSLEYSEPEEEGGGRF